MHNEISARVVSAGVRRGQAVSRIEVESASVQEVRDMFLQEPPEAFFPGASDYFRRSTPDGGQRFLENPLGGPPIMLTRIAPTASGIRASFQGLMYGHADLSIRSEGSRTVIEETGTVARPNLRLNPFQRLAESVPLFGVMPALLRQSVEYGIGTGLAALHALLAGRDNAQAIAATLQRRRDSL